MPRIENVSYADIRTGSHLAPQGAGGVLIQLLDPDMTFPEPAKPFAERHQFKFLDLEDVEHPAAITPLQAQAIAAVLRSALEAGQDVVVHCHAGICRSGAVAEVGVMLGFEDTGRYRAPNLLVKRRLTEALGFASYTNEDD